ncbi:MAG: hypothetical protein AAF363_15630 [Bacteroidota bacterium]
MNKVLIYLTVVRQNLISSIDSNDFEVWKYDDGEKRNVSESKAIARSIIDDHILGLQQLKEKINKNSFESIQEMIY